jgi:hypothetical protein
MSNKKRIDARIITPRYNQRLCNVGFITWEHTHTRPRPEPYREYIPLPGVSVYILKEDNVLAFPAYGWESARCITYYPDKKHLPR